MPKAKSKVPAKKSGTPPTRRSLWLALRAVGAFALLGVLIALLYWWGYNSYPDVAEWAEPGNHDAFIYEGETYYLAGQINKKGLTKATYPMDKLLGQIKDDGTPIATEPETETETETEEVDPEDTETPEETETAIESVVPPAGADLFQNRKHAYILYTVEKKEQYLLLLQEDGEYYLYYREGTENPADSD